MPVKTEQELPDNLRQSWLKALTAYEMKNYGYAISLLQPILTVMPDFLQGRRFLRQAEIAKSHGKKSFLGGLSSASIGSVKLQNLVKKDPSEALVSVERLLESEPANQAANFVLRDAALALGMIETATFALETLKDAYPKDTKILHALARHYYEHEDPNKCVEICNLINEIHPSDLAAVKLGKDAAARASMSGGGWDSAESYRDLIKDKEGAILLEQQSRVTKSEDVIESQLAELGRLYQEQPENLDTARKIAALYESRADLDNALTWYEYASTLAKGSDPVLLRKTSEIGLKKTEVRISELNAWLLEVGDEHEEVPRVREEIAALQVRQAESRLGEAKRRVERNPTDLQLRLEYGQQLVQAGHVGEAIPELQQARRSPSARYKAMILLGRCYVAKNMIDLAAKQLEEASNELRAMDDTKKEVVYNLGLIYDQMGKTVESLNCMKMIYEVDYGYRDVAKRVESSYGGDT